MRVFTLGDVRVFLGLASKISPFGFNVKFDADVKKTAERQQCDQEQEESLLGGGYLPLRVSGGTECLPFRDRLRSVAECLLGGGYLPLRDRKKRGSLSPRDRLGGDVVDR